ncbi:hypothetical protein XENOCAPTIV_017975 [Xenoophorus captivus]|uniref:Sushi domain-containing protein n=1 Tax=Xenoophorus captivus TaxID=1517983 RepID=A0ABV0SA68_9TELE
MKPLWLIFLFLQVFVNLEVSWTQIVSTCEMGVLHPHLFIAGMLSAGEVIKVGHKLRFLCGAEHKLDGSEEIECLPTGQWSATFPTCSVNTCEIGVLHPHLFIAGMQSAGEAIKAGQKLRFLCGANYELDGSEEIECLQTGQWSATFPTCSGTFTKSAVKKYFSFYRLSLFCHTSDLQTNFYTT